VVLLLDSATLPASQRDEALSALISQASGPTRVSHDVADELIDNKTHYWNVGDGNGLIRTQDNAIRFSRTARQARSNDRDLFAITVQLRGTGLIVESAKSVVQQTGELSLHRVAREHAFAFRGKAENASFLLSRDDLGLPLAYVVNAAPKLASSPVYGLLQAHFAGLCDAAQEVSANKTSSTLLASATVQLIRAMVASTDGPSDLRSRDVIHDSAPTTVLAYIRHNLSDPNLDAARIATANSMTVSDLRAMWSQMPQSIDEWIMNARLESVRNALADEKQVFGHFDDLARHWGISNVTEFRVQFRSALGLSPDALSDGKSILSKREPSVGPSPSGWLDESRYDG
jgi:AraC-like DNA-binding protein